MCGRYTLHTERELLEERFATTLAPLAPRFNIAPTQPVIVIRMKDGERVAREMRWGLIPFWAKAGAKLPSMINARRESLDKPAYRRAFARRRCLILADGFYEWQASEGPSRRKIPHWIHLEERRPFAFAGIWEIWRPEDDLVERVLSCSIVTAPANTAIAPVHDRMPVVLPPEHEAHWIDPAENDANALAALLEPLAAEHFAMHPVSTDVNKATNESPHLIEPDDHQPELGFFELWRDD